MTHDAEPSVSGPKFSSSQQLSKQQIRRSTRPRLCWAACSSVLLLISVIFLILVELGGTRVSKTLNKIYFINLNLSDVVPTTVPDSGLINSIAQSLGLHDCYTVGLWGFCEGYDVQGFTACSAPKALYWFNPVEIIRDQLLAGASISLPAEIDNDLDLIRVASHWMFGLFLTGACVNFVMVFLTPLSVSSRWVALPIMIFTFVGALVTTVAAVIATALFVIMKNAVTAETTLNIKASLGVEMFAFFWIASASAILAWIVQLCLCCCCTSRRDVKRAGKREGKHEEAEKSSLDV